VRHRISAGCPQFLLHITLQGAYNASNTCTVCLQIHTLSFDTLQSAHGTGAKFGTPLTATIDGTKPPQHSPNLVSHVLASLSPPSPMNSTNPGQEVPVKVSTDATEPREETNHSLPPAPGTTPTVAGSAEHHIIHTHVTRRQADTRLHTRPEPGCKPEHSNIIEPESQKDSLSKRLRTTFTQDQSALLEKKYALNGKPSREVRLEIAQELRLWVSFYSLRNITSISILYARIGARGVPYSHTQG